MRTENFIPLLGILEVELLTNVQKITFDILVNIRVRDSNSIYVNTTFEFDIRIRHRKSNIRIRTFGFVIQNLTFVFEHSTNFEYFTFVHSSVFLDRQVFKLGLTGWEMILMTYNMIFIKHVHI